MNGYCEKAEGFYDTYTTTQTKMLPEDQWTVSNNTKRTDNNVNNTL